MPILVYGHEGCPMVVPVRIILNRANVLYEYINIHKDADAAARVRAINNGNESVPTLVFEDGSTLTEPSAAELSARLKALGIEVVERTQILARASLYVALIGGGLLGLLIGGVLGNPGLGLIVGTGVGFAANVVLIRTAGN
jgi:mycoredoxin